MFARDKRIENHEIKQLLTLDCAYQFPELKSCPLSSQSFLLLLHTYHQMAEVQNALAFRLQALQFCVPGLHRFFQFLTAQMQPIPVSSQPHRTELHLKGRSGLREGGTESA